jgi:hypothetical protein
MLSMLRKSTAFMPRYYKFESSFLQRGVQYKLEFVPPVAGLEQRTASSRGDSERQLDEIVAHGVRNARSGRGWG